MKLGRQCNYHKGQAALRHYAKLTNPPVPYDFWSASQFYVYFRGLTPIEHSVLNNSVLNVKALVGAFNQ